MLILFIVVKLVVKLKVLIIHNCYNSITDLQTAQLH